MNPYKQERKAEGCNKENTRGIQNPRKLDVPLVVLQRGRCRTLGGLHGQRMAMSLQPARKWLPQSCDYRI